MANEPSYIDDVHRDIVEFVGRHGDFFDDDEKTSEFVDAMLEKKGYQRSSVWTPPSPKPKGSPKGSGYFSR